MTDLAAPGQDECPDWCRRNHQYDPPPPHEHDSYRNPMQLRGKGYVQLNLYRRGAGETKILLTLFSEMWLGGRKPTKPTVTYELTDTDLEGLTDLATEVLSDYQAEAEGHDTAADEDLTDEVEDVRSVLVNSEEAPPPVWANAHNHALHRIGTAAERIEWADAYSVCGITGTLRDATTTLDLIYRHEEPGSEDLYVRVPCPDEPNCREAIQLVESVEDLLAVLDGTTDPDEVHCPDHQCYR